MNFAEPLFAYGTLMFPEVIAAVIGRVPPAQPASATGFERREIIGQWYPGLVRSRSANPVNGIVYDGLTRPDWAKLNAYEGDFYELTAIAITRDGQEEAALVYLVPESGRSRLGRAHWDPEAFRRLRLASYLAGQAGCAQDRVPGGHPIEADSPEADIRTS
ncbi:MAG TPA: gamma-glutamylcyclotransferase [Terrimicrobiaceae bacterium]|nr:gamma-glutamylcyclotransferase [Terrimicrobiaceae bacterium]